MQEYKYSPLLLYSSAQTFKHHKWSMHNCNWSVLHIIPWHRNHAKIQSLDRYSPSHKSHHTHRGGHSGLGLATRKHLSRHNATIYITAWPSSKIAAHAAIKDVKKEQKHATLQLHDLEMNQAEFASVRKRAANFLSWVHSFQTRRNQKIPPTHSPSPISKAKNCISSLPRVPKIWPYVISNL